MPRSTQAVTKKRVRDKEAKQQALLEAALEVFVELEFERATTAEIARRAGCSESLIFRYFGDKQGLFEATLVQHLDEMTRLAEEQLNDRLPDRVEDYIAQLSTVRRRLARSSVATMSFLSRALTDPEFSYRTYKPAHERRVALIADGLRAYQDEGQIRADVDIDNVSEILAYSIGFAETLQPHLLGEGMKRRRELADATVTLVMDGIRGPAAHA